MKKIKMIGIRSIFNITIWKFNIKIKKQKIIKIINKISINHIQIISQTFNYTHGFQVMISEYNLLK